MEQRIQAFQKVRDIPYYISAGDEPDYCCLSKSQMLSDELKKLGIKSRLVITTFRWEDTETPESVLSIAHPDPEEHA